MEGRAGGERNSRLNRITIRDVAELAKVSPASVSNYFHRPRKLSEGTRQRIRQAVDTLGFVPNDAARTLRTGVSPVIGYIAFELAGATTPEIAAAIEQRVSAEGMYMLMANDTGSEQRERSYLQLFAKQQVSGVIIAPVGNVEAELARMRSFGIASVLSARRAESPEQASVSIDHVAGGRLAAAHLIEQGRKRIGFVSSSLELKQVSDRLNGALSAVHAASGVTFEVIPVRERSVEAGIACAEALVRRPAAERPDALFCANDLLAIGVVQAFVATDVVRVPADVAVVGYDDIEFARSTIVPLTTVRTPQAELGTAVADLLFAELDAMTSAEIALPRPQIEFSPELVVRASTVRP
ncbi:LacI family DNA-binding transcriptional regulator [Amycolatopsis rhabdoformis]|uniref:LacI family DNA-binding transcriptional regulator n=1 Tax=Amycolatopsis rhabdoformis TaxID=1448059 RepID=A0ABZ1IL74_9PSEU|nr:LacI family DNA-binding transcriptional regulator [Amycolatopsis rhabdoformis]WSE35172.1 LacI family DNA-binding transcriptional regulator [Amycolatopsis rhabdoformis]